MPKTYICKKQTKTKKSRCPNQWGGGFFLFDKKQAFPQQEFLLFRKPDLLELYR